MKTEKERREAGGKSGVGEQGVLEVTSRRSLRSREWTPGQNSAECLSKVNAKT